MKKQGESRPARWSRAALALMFVGAGALHFARPELYARVVPPGFPYPAALVSLSGAAEIAGGIGVLLPEVRRWAGWGLIALLVAVFPVNVHMALTPGAPPALLWLRLPLQAVLVAWVWRSTQSRPESAAPGSRSAG
ncbi:MAG: DoxX family protein [Gemmatimonadota bacterium]|nr:DoxX family protein [Gemmatimonadota bacterium]